MYVCIYFLKVKLQREDMSGSQPLSNIECVLGHTFGIKSEKCGVM